jgi:hypothetical protein
MPRWQAADRRHARKAWWRCLPNRRASPLPGPAFLSWRAHLGGGDKTSSPGSTERAGNAWFSQKGGFVQ